MSMYVSDARADELVASDKLLQDVIAGRRLVFWLPGYGAAVGETIALLIGWIGTGIVVNRLVFPPRTAWFLVATVVVVSLISWCAYRVLMGHPRARARLNQLGTIQNISGIA